jgi:hypothetical protein
MPRTQAQQNEQRRRDHIAKIMAQPVRVCLDCPSELPRQFGCGRKQTMCSACAYRRKCANANEARWGQHHPERCAEARKIWCAQNKERIRRREQATRARRREAMPDVFRERRRANYLKHRDNEIALAKQWISAHPDAVREIQRRRTIRDAVAGLPPELHEMRLLLIDYRSAVRKMNAVSL